MRCFYCGRRVVAEAGQVRRRAVAWRNGWSRLDITEVAHALCAAPAVTGGWKAPPDGSKPDALDV